MTRAAGSRPRKPHLFSCAHAADRVKRSDPIVRCMHALGLRSARHIARANCDRTRSASAGGGGLDRSGHADPAGRQAGRGAARHRGADARGDAGDRGLQPALCRERRALHDRDADVPVRHRDAEDHAGHLHSVRPSAGHRALRRSAPVRHRRAQIGARVPAQGVGRDGADGSARRGDRPLRRHSGAHRRRGRPGLAFDLRARTTKPRRRPTTTCSRRSAARAISPPRCARAWSRSAACCCSSPTRPKA